MANATDEIARRLSTIPSVQQGTAQYDSTNPDGTVLVEFGQGLVQIYSAGLYAPLPGDYVRVLQIDEFTLMLGAVVPKSAYGRVTATGTPLLTVSLPDGSSVQLPRVSSAYPSPAVNDDVLINWANGGMVIGQVTQVPVSGYFPPPKPIPAPGAGSTKPTSFSVDFRAKDSGSYININGRWEKNEVWCSDNNIGAWFYNNIDGTIPDGAVIDSVQLYVPEFYNDFPGSLATIGLHSLSSKSGAPSMSSVVTISAGTGWKTLPKAFGDALKTGSKFGVGTNHGGFHKFRSRAQDPQSGMLRIKWRI